MVFPYATELSSFSLLWIYFLSIKSIAFGRIFPVLWVFHSLTLPKNLMYLNIWKGFLKLPFYKHINNYCGTWIYCGNTGSRGREYLALQLPQLIVIAWLSFSWCMCLNSICNPRKHTDSQRRILGQFSFNCMDAILSSCLTREW